MGYDASTEPRQAPYEVDELIDAVQHLDDADLNKLLDALAGMQAVENAGWTVRERRLSVEKLPARNAAIRKERKRGLSYAQIGRKFGMSRYAVRNIIKRGERSVNAKNVFTTQYGYHSNRRKLRA